MKMLSTLIISIVSLTVLAAAPAAAREIACPHDQVRTEIVTSLPDSWWQTPQVGSLQSTEVGTVGGETTLICRYRAYGTTVSVMRLPPDRRPNCTAQEGGFDCRRGRAEGPVDIRPEILEELLPGMITPVAVTYSTGPLSVPQTWRADLDEGSIDSGTRDFWFRAETARNRYLQPQNGALFGIYPGAGGGSGISRQDCVDTPKSHNTIPVSSLNVGTYVCYRTSEGRHGLFRVNQPIGRSPGTMELGYTTWE